MPFLFATAPGTRTFIKRLCDLVKCYEKYKPAVDIMLGGSGDLIAALDLLVISCAAIKALNQNGPR